MRQPFHLQRHCDAGEFRNSLVLRVGERRFAARVLAGLRLKLEKVFNLVAKTALVKALDMDVILAEDWRGVNDGGSESLGQALGRAAHDLGAEGFTTPSAHVEDGVNITVFPEALRPDSRMEVIGREELDRWIKKR